MHSLCFIFFPQMSVEELSFNLLLQNHSKLDSLSYINAMPVRQLIGQKKSIKVATVAHGNRNAMSTGSVQCSLKIYCLRIAHDYKRS